MIWTEYVWHVLASVTPTFKTVALKNAEVFLHPVLTFISQMGKTSLSIKYFNLGLWRAVFIHLVNL